MKRVKRYFLVPMLVLSLMSGFFLTPAASYAAEGEEDPVKAAYMEKIYVLYEDIYAAEGDMINKMSYQFVDLNGDGTDEMLIDVGFGYLTETIYTYKNGEAIESLNTSHGYITKYYPSIGVLYEYGGHMGQYWDRYYTMGKNGVCKFTAEKVKIENPKTGKYTVEYRVNNKKCKKKKYNKCVAKIKKAKCVKIPDNWTDYKKQ